jgi:Mrp family chromosome partitioning ATPase/LPS O-antigen subunit length determinant protein (WzzB/FepE family)
MVDTPMTPADSVWPAAADSAETITLADALVFVRRQFWVIAGAVAAMAVLAALYILLTPSEYLARAELLIEPGKQHALWQDSGVVDLTIDNAQVESQVEVLRSERIANDVIANLGLINDADFSHPGTDYERQRAVLAQFENALSARRVGQSYVIEVSFRSRDPDKAARITNAVTDAYLRDQQQAKQDVAEQASQWMEKQITDLGVQLNTAAAAAQEFRVSHGINGTATNNGGQPQLLDKLTQLESKAEAYRKVYEGLLERFTENQQQASYPVSNARVITSAARPLVRTYPKSKLVLLLSLLVGLVVGIAVAAARAVLDGSVRSAKQVSQATGLSVLGVLPRSQNASAAGARSEDWVEVLDAPLSPLSEAIRGARISVQHACGGRSGYCLGILSLLPDEAATTVTTNLAALFEASGTKTLLVDADLRERRLTRQLAQDTTIGFADAVRAGSADALLYERKTKAHLLAAGLNTPINDVDGLLDSPGFSTLLATLKEEFGAILVDLPALGRVGDARAAGPLLDGCVLVCTYGRTPLRALEDAVELLRADNVVLFGVVITDVSTDIPPLFGWHLDDVRETGFGGLIQRLAGQMRHRFARGALR